MSIQKLLKKTGACREGSEWVGEKSAKEAWDTCKRGDWMLWAAKKQNIRLEVLTLAKVRCARLVEHLMKDDRSVAALAAAERFANGEISRVELDDAADAAAYAAYADAAAYAAYAADAAYAAYAAAAAYAADTAAAYAAYADADAAIEDILAKCADICRATISFESLNIEDE